MNNVQRLGIVTALQKELKDISNDLRADVAREMPEEGGNRNIVLGGKKVGTVSVSLPTVTEQQEVPELHLEDECGFAGWLGEQDVTAMAQFIQAHAQEYASEYFEDTGEVPEGFSLHTVVKPATSKPGVMRVTGCKFEAVNNALGGLTQSTINLLLEETSD